MFTNLIESDSHRQEFKRRSSFFLATVAAYALILSAAGVASIYAYDAHLEAQSNDLALLSWVPPVTPPTTTPKNNDNQNNRRPRSASTTTDPHLNVPVRTNLITTTDDPTKVPDKIGTIADPAPPAPKNAVLGKINADPVGPPTNSTACVTCSGSDTGSPKVVVEDKPPAPVVVKPKTERLTSTVLVSKAISLPQPAYPPIARQIHLGGTVAVQILVDEQGKVIMAQIVSGHPTLTPAAKEAAMRARFTPTMLNGQAVKVQGVITYNFLMQ
jgi:TonB family protein